MAPVAYVTNTGARTVSVIDLSTNGVIVSPAVEGAPIGLAITPDRKQPYVTNSGAATKNVSVIDTVQNKVLGEITDGDQAFRHRHQILIAQGFNFGGICFKRWPRLRGCAWGFHAGHW